jgi:hypothetical protein
LPETPPTLAYDSHNTIKDPRAHWIIPGYCAGIMLTGVAYAVVSFVLVAHGSSDLVVRLISGIVAPLGFAFVSLLPQIITLGMTLWLKRKIVKEVRFDGFRPAFMWGVGGGLMPWPLFPFLQDLGVFQTVFWFGALAWFLIFPAIAGTFLCYRSHIRD